MYIDELDNKLLETAVRVGDSRRPLRQVIAEECIPAFISAFLSALRTAMSGEKRVELQLRFPRVLQLLIWVCD